MSKKPDSKKIPDPRVIFPLSEFPEDDTPDDGQIDITSGSFDPFALKKESESSDSPEDVLDLTGELHGERFPLKKSNNEEEFKPVINMTGAPVEGNKFPLKKPYSKEEKIFGSEGELIFPKSPIRDGANKRKPLKTAFKISVALAILLGVFILWLIGGRIYTNYLNESLYKRFRGGENMSRINPDFDFFLTFEKTGDSFPVVRSEKPMYYTAFNSLPFAPGTLTSLTRSTNVIVTGSPSLLSAVKECQKGDILLFEKGLAITRYKIYEIHECPKDLSSLEDDGSLTVYIKDSSAENGIFAVHARIEE